MNGPNVRLFYGGVEGFDLWGGLLGPHRSNLDAADAAGTGGGILLAHPYRLVKILAVKDLVAHQCSFVSAKGPSRITGRPSTTRTVVAVAWGASGSPATKAPARAPGP